MDRIKEATEPGLLTPKNIITPEEAIRERIDNMRFTIHRSVGGSLQDEKNYRSMSHDTSSFVIFNDLKDNGTPHAVVSNRNGAVGEILERLIDHITGFNFSKERERARANEYLFGEKKDLETANQRYQRLFDIFQATLYIMSGELTNRFPVNDGCWSRPNWRPSRHIPSPENLDTHLIHRPNDPNIEERLIHKLKSLFLSWLDGEVPDKDCSVLEQRGFRGSNPNGLLLGDKFSRKFLILNPEELHRRERQEKSFKEAEEADRKRAEEADRKRAEEAERKRVEAARKIEEASAEAQKQK